MRRVGTVVFLLAIVAALGGCNRDPNVAKKRYLDSGNKYFERGKYKEASIMYRNALQKDMRYGPAHYRLGLTYIKLSELAPAVQSLRRAVELLPTEQPDHWDATIKLSEIYLAASPGKQYLDEVDGYIKQLLKRDPNSYDAHRLNGDLNYVRSSDAIRNRQREQARTFLDQAIAEYRKADAIKPDQIGINMQLARALSAEGDSAGAEKLYRAIIARNKTADFAYPELYRLLMVTGKPDEAEQVLKLGFQNDPKQYAFLTMLAAHYYGTNRRDDMRQVLAQIKSHAKDFPAAYLTVGDFYLRTNDNDAAIQAYREGASSDAKQKLTYQKRILEVLMRQGKREEASQLTAEILKADPNDSDAQGLAASLLLDKGDVNRALTDLQAVVTRSPNNPVAHFNLGRAHQARNEWEEARQEYQKALDLQPGYVAARLSLAQLQLQRQEWEGAFRSAEQAIAADPKNLSARLIESTALMGQQRFADARSLLEQLAKAAPQSPEVQYQLGLVNLTDKRYKEAEVFFRRSYDLNPKDSRGLLGLVQTYVADGRGDQAIAFVQAEEAKAPQRPDLRIASAAAAVLMQKYDMAVAEYQAALAVPGQDSRTRADIYVRLGEVYRDKGDFNRAVASLQEARKAVPDNPMVLTTLALSLDGAGKRAEAQQIYEAAVKADPNNGVALNNLAFLMADSGGDLDQALTFAQRAKQLLPNLAEVSDTLGLIYLRKNLSDNAVGIFKELVSKQPNTSIFHYHLGMALSQKGDKPQALQELQHALKNNPSKQEKEKIQQLMTRLG